MASVRLGTMHLSWTYAKHAQETCLAHGFSMSYLYHSCLKLELIWGKWCSLKGKRQQMTILLLQNRHLIWFVWVSWSSLVWVFYLWKGIFSDRQVLLQELWSDDAERKSSKKALYIIRCQGSASGLGWFEPSNLAIVPATLPLSYTLKLKSLARKVFHIQVSRA